jgi:anaphase-promoting complex subunit 2
LTLRRLPLQVTQLHGELASALRAVLTKRSLHPGATTTQILEIYIATIKVLRLLDPSDALLDAVCVPVRDYLRRRRDTVALARRPAHSSSTVHDCPPPPSP